jgi:hypothetical protein
VTASVEFAGEAVPAGITKMLAGHRTIAGETLDEPDGA